MRDKKLFDLYHKIIKERDPDKLTKLVAELLKPLTQAGAAGHTGSKRDLKRTARAA